MPKKIYQCPHCETELMITKGQLEEVQQIVEQPQGDSSVYQDSYNTGTPVVPGTKQGDYVVNTPLTQHGSGIRVVTNVGKASGVRHKPPRTAQPAGDMKGVFGPKKKQLSELTDADHSREGFEVLGAEDSFMNDYFGSSGAEGHLDRLELQEMLDEANSQDLRQRGF